MRNEKDHYRVDYIRKSDQVFYEDKISELQKFANNLEMRVGKVVEENTELRASLAAQVRHNMLETVKKYELRQKIEIAKAAIQSLITTESKSFVEKTLSRITKNHKL